MVTFMPLPLYLRAKNPRYPSETELVSNIIKYEHKFSSLFLNNEAVRIKLLLMVCSSTLAVSQNVWSPVFA
jgi:hypothetical protein